MVVSARCCASWGGVQLECERWRCCGAPYRTHLAQGAEIRMQGGNNGELGHKLAFSLCATDAEGRNFKRILEPRDVGAIPSAMVETPLRSKTHPSYSAIKILDTVTSSTLGSESRQSLPVNLSQEPSWPPRLNLAPYKSSLISTP